MYLMLRINGQIAQLDMEQSGERELMVGEHTYRPGMMARRIRKLATRMWGNDLAPAVLAERISFEAIDNNGGRWGDSGNFTPANGVTVALGRWNEDATIAIALHELAHEMHLRDGGYDHSDGIMREALALLAEREVGMVRSFDREPYYTASNLVDELCELWAFQKLPFRRRWAEVVVLTNGSGLSDLINYYLDRNDGIGLGRWIKRVSDRVDVRDGLLSTLANCSLRYSLEYRRTLLRNLVRCPAGTPINQLLQVLDAVMQLDRRHPDDDLSEIITFCFAPLARTRRLPAFG